MAWGTKLGMWIHNESYIYDIMSYMHPFWCPVDVVPQDFRRRTQEPRVEAQVGPRCDPMAGTSREK
jgi:hypothetical protein